MAADQNILGLINASGEGRRAPLVGVDFLHQIAMRPRNVFGARSLLKPKDFVGFILGHRSRAETVGAPVAISLSCVTPAGEPAVEIRFK